MSYSKSLVKLISVMLFYSSTLFSQINIHCSINMNEAIRLDSFSNNEGDQILISGNFNSWNGNEFFLHRKDSSNSIFTNQFPIRYNIGDTLEYKFVIKKANGSLFWEENPNPSNPNYGNRITIVTSELVYLTAGSFKLGLYTKYPVVFEKNNLQQDYMKLREICESTHPALYDYTDKHILDSLFNHQYTMIKEDMEFEEFYKLISEPVVSIGCGHTSLWVPNVYWNVAPDGLFPLKLYFSQEKVLVAGFYDKINNVPIGSEIISINGLSISEIINDLKSTSPSDGFIDAYKSKMVEKHFSKKYALQYGFPKDFSIQFLAPNSEIKSMTSISPTSMQDIKDFDSKENQLSYEILNEFNSLVLTINSFGYYDKREFFYSFIDSTFRTLSQQKIANLIIDLRGNSGGDPFCSSYLLRHLTEKSIIYFEKQYGKDTTLNNPSEPVENVYTGNIFTLIDGGGFSTTGHLTALLKYHNIGKLIGSETGASFTCTGSVAYIELPQSKITIGCARHRRYTVVVEGMDPRSGIIPDYEVWLTQDDIMNGRDGILQFSLDLTRNINN